MTTAPPWPSVAGSFLHFLTTEHAGRDSLGGRLLTALRQKPPPWPVSARWTFANWMAHLRWHGLADHADAMTAAWGAFVLRGTRAASARAATRPERQAQDAVVAALHEGRPRP